MQEGTPIIIKKVKKGGHGHHGGAWKVAYADFVTAMMAFFLVMWILGMSDDQKAAIAAYFNDPQGIAKKGQGFPPVLGISDKPAGGPSNENAVTLENQQLSQVKNDIENRIDGDENLEGLIENGDFSIRNTSEGLLVELIENETSGELFFKSGSSQVRPKAEQVFATIAPILGETKRVIQIEGHTDAEPFGSASYDNYDLSTERALAVKRLLLRNGVSYGQIHEVTGKADTDPRMPEDPYHFSNRRVTILLPYKYAQGETMKLPAQIQDEAIQGAFSMPSSGVAPDLQGEYAAEKAAEAEESGEGGNGP